MPDSGSQADDLDERVGSDEFIGGRLAGGHESDVYSSLDRTGENGDAGMGTGSTERLVRPSQMKKNKQGKCRHYRPKRFRIWINSPIHFSILTNTICLMKL